MRVGVGSEEDVGDSVDGNPGVGPETPGLPVLELTPVLLVEDEVPGGGVGTDEVSEVEDGNRGGTINEWLTKDFTGGSREKAYQILSAVGRED